MKKLMTLVLVLFIPVLFAENSDAALKEAQEGMNGPYAPVDQSPVRPMVQTSRGLGDILLTIDALALGIDGPSGITWDGTYLYVMSLMNDSCYVVDPTVPAVVYGFPTPPTNSFGIGQEQNLWLTCITTDSIYEYTHAGVPTGNGFPGVVGGASWFADGSEWWPNGEIWFIAVGGTKKAYKFEVPSGAVLDSIGHPRWLIDSQRGMTYDPGNKKFWVGGWVSDSVWEVDRTGTPTGRAFYMDGCAGIVYDWHSTLHPYPVLWICRQAADEIVMVDPDNIPITWDFETGWQGWTHTNGLPFPGGWEPYDADWRAPTYQCPSSGDSSMWIDSDEYFDPTADTALSPVLVPNPTTNWLWYAFLYNDITPGGGDYFEVGIKYFDGATWTVVPLTSYDSDYYGDWDSVDVSAYNAYDLIQVYFYYYAASWDWYAAFDNVSINATIPMHDVLCNPVLSPLPGFITPGDHDVIGRIRNFGDFAETFNVTANVYDTTDAWNLIFNQTVTLTDFPVDGDSLVNFGSASLGEAIYYTEIYTELVDDDNPSNDTSSIYSATLTTFDLVYDFETGWQGWTHTNGLPFPQGWGIMPSSYKPLWTPPDAGDSCLWIDSDAAGSGVLVQDTALSPAILPDHETEYLKYGIGYNWLSAAEIMEVGIKYFDGTSWTAVPLKNYFTDTGPMYDLIDVSGYNTCDSIQIYTYYEGEYDWYVAIDNLMINEGETGIAERPTDREPLVFGFARNISNPIKEHATISYGTTIRGKVSLRVYDATGRLLRTLVDKNEPAGTKTVYWDGRDDAQRNVSDGVYFFRLEAEGKVDTRKMILVR